MDGVLPVVAGPTSDLTPPGNSVGGLVDAVDELGRSGEDGRGHHQHLDGPLAVEGDDPVLGVGELLLGGHCASFHELGSHSKPCYFRELLILIAK